MMKKTLILLPILLLLSFALPATFERASRAADDRAEQRANLERIALSYVQAFYEVKPELLEKCLHDDLDKYGFWRAPGGKSYRGMGTNKKSLIALASTLNKDGHIGADAVKKAEVLDMLDQIAVIKVTADWGIDYLQLAKYEGQWKVRQALWQSHPE